jgi:hypothetical protein
MDFDLPRRLHHPPSIAAVDLLSTNATGRPETRQRLPGGNLREALSLMGSLGPSKDCGVPVSKAGAVEISSTPVVSQVSNGHVTAERFTARHGITA